MIRQPWLLVMMSALDDSATPIIELRGLSKSYRSRSAPNVVALNQVSLRIAEGEFVAIVGPSGGGKTTLLNILGLLDFPDQGEYMLNGVPAPAREGTLAARLRSKKFAFVFQSFHLLEGRPVLDSVELGLMYRGVTARSDPAVSALGRVGLEDRAEERTSHLSGGQRQRVAIARAIASNAAIVLADEPTGNLDTESAKSVIRELKALHEAGATVVVVTHSADVAAAADRQLRIQDGRLASDTRRTLSVGPQRQALRQGRRNDAPAAARPTRAINLRPRRTSPDSRLRLRDVFRDAWRSVCSRPAQSLALCFAVSIAVALTLISLGLSASAGAQVTSAFDAELNREVTATWDLSPTSLAAPFVDVPGRTGRLAGVSVSAAIANFDPATVVGAADARSVQPHTYVGDIVAAARLTVRWASWRSESPLKSNEVLIGAQLATLLGVGSLDSGPVVTINHLDYQVAGIVEQSPRLPLLAGELILAQDAPGYSHPNTIKALLLTQAGAAQQVARQVSVAIDPYSPETLVIQAPTDATALRATVEQGVQTTLVAFSILAMAAAIGAISNSMLLAVAARRGEIGLRKALGARSRHVAGLFAAESALVGAAGGVLGLIAGVLTILVVTLSQRWTPVFDLRLGPLAVTAGVLIGGLGGVLASIRAARIRPTEALRQ